MLNMSLALLQQHILAFPDIKEKSCRQQGRCLWESHILPNDI